MDMDSILKTLALVGIGAVGYHFYTQKQAKTNPDEIDSESQMARIERMLREHELSGTKGKLDHV